MKNLNLIGLLLALTLSQMAQAGRRYPSSPFEGMTDNGLKIGCIQSGVDSLLGQPTYNCRLERGAISIDVTDTNAQNKKFTCDIDSEGQIGDCGPQDVSYLLHMKFFIKTDSVNTGLVSCWNNVVSFGSWENMFCAAHFNNEAGPNGVVEGWKTVADCSTTDDKKILLQTIDHDLGDGKLWPKSSFVLNAFGFPSRAYVVGRDSTDGLAKVSVSDLSSQTTFASDSMILMLSKPIGHSSPGDIVDGTYSGKPVKCLITP